MHADTAFQASGVSKGELWAGWILTGLVSAFLTLDAIVKFVKPPPVLQACAHLGWPADRITVLGFVLLGCIILYLIPKTSVLGAICMTGYLGGAVAAHTRAGDPLFTHVLFPVYFGILVWLGLYLRESRLRALVPVKS